MTISLLTVAWVTVTTLLVISLPAALLALACVPWLRSVVAVMSADAFLTILLYPLLSTASGAAAGAGAAEVQGGRAPAGLSLINFAVIVAMVIGLVVTAVVRRRISLEPIEPGSFAARQRDQRHLADLRALSAAERAYFAERAQSWAAQADALRAESTSLPARRAWAALSPRWRVATCTPAAAGMALTVAVAIRYEAAWPLIADFGPPAAVPVIRLVRRRECEITARHLGQDADAMIRQLAILPTEARLRPRRSRWLGACGLLGALAATACLATTRSTAMPRSCRKPATRSPESSGRRGPVAS